MLTRVGPWLLVVAAAAGGAAVVWTALVPRFSPVTHGVAIGALAGGTVALAFWGGALTAGRGRAGAPPRGAADRPSSVSPEEAKRWLQAFLREHQRPPTPPRG